MAALPLPLLEVVERGLQVDYRTASGNCRLLVCTDCEHLGRRVTLQAVHSEHAEPHVLYGIDLQEN